MRILYVTTISLTMNSFFKPHIKMLVNEGNEVDLACNYKDLALDKLYEELNCGFHQIPVRTRYQRNQKLMKIGLYFTVQADFLFKLCYKILNNTCNLYLILL